MNFVTVYPSKLEWHWFDDFFHIKGSQHTIKAAFFIYVVHLHLRPYTHTRAPKPAGTDTAGWWRSLLSKLLL